MLLTTISGEDESAVAPSSDASSLRRVRHHRFRRDLLSLTSLYLLKTETARPMICGIAKAHRKAEKKRASAEAKRGTNVPKVLEICNLMRALGRDPSKRQN
ncbi:hypothetical protein QQ045_001934 [Rhodiola kirilowii]